MTTKNQIKNINNEFDKGYFLYSAYKKSSMPIIFDVIENKENKVFVMNSENSKKVWLPKSAFTLCDLRLSLTLKHQFKTTIEFNSYKKSALSI